ncbi:M20/M25/M40 family metallo-hydrolase [Fusibacter paucivorans]|uniref:M20/M25/M40 family metallo-hydrolase n=1 Tax=Fusibacter paucivorans TaxID=76009 RepID=A0ABS5PT25_9FIRM|nr:M20/M25/M40 family metallo-hydrolase [Fusibacter paucivorans]MBS7527207.1 M20/M25/M40 family metallo-hydrolase [Fusibacter paucivorans]
MDLKFMAALSSAKGVSGFEKEVVEVIRQYVGDRLTVTIDQMHNVILRRPCDNDSDDVPVVMLDAHSDEIGFIIQSIQANGTLKFLPLGGWSDQNVSAQKVWIKNAEGTYIQGIVASKPPHFTTGPAKLTPIGEMSIDVGATSFDEVASIFKIEPGAPVVPYATFSYIEETGIMCGKAFDNRLGCNAVVETMLALADTPLNVKLVGAISAQEEVGLRGAGINARKIKPDLAIVFEGTPADDTFKNAYDSQGALKKGTQIRHFDRSMIANADLIAYAIATAKSEGIAYQRAVREGGGTNAGAIHLADDGVPCLVLGTPVRYAHTHHGYSAVADQEATIALAKAIIQKISPEDKERLLF